MELLKTVKKDIKRCGQQSSVEKPGFSEGSNFDGISVTKTE